MVRGVLRRRAKYGRSCLLLFSSTCSSFCSSAAADHHARGSSVWKVKEVTKANFAAAMEEVREHIRNAHYIAVCSQKTGGAFSATGGSGSATPWHCRVFPVDTPDTAYLKAKHAAEKFELLQFAVCPFRIQGSKLIALPYNFNLFPRDDLNLGMPSYSFSCQTSRLTTMAQEGFDFNECMYNGISYLSRAQEASAKDRIKNPIPSVCTVKSSSTPSVADSIFMQRIKSRVQHWKDACNNSSKTTEEALVRSLRKLILRGEIYGSRPCLSIDVSNVRQVQLIVEILTEFSDDLVPLLIPDKGGEPKAVRVVLTSSEEDKKLLKSELQHLEEEQDREIRGFREVIDAISASHKPVVSYGCLTEFAFIHSKFISPLPPTMEEFMCSLRLVFSVVLDLNHLFKEVDPLKKANNLHAAMSYLKRQFFIPLDVEIPHEVHQGNLVKDHAVLKMTHTFAKLCSLLKNTPCESVVHDCPTPLEEYSNKFYPFYSSKNEPGEDVPSLSTKCFSEEWNSENVFFLWGFGPGITGGELKNLLCGTHGEFSVDLEVQTVDKSCFAVVCRRPGLANLLLKIMQGSCEAVGFSALREMISEGLKAAGYEAYRKACRFGYLEASLGDSLDRALLEQPCSDPTIDCSSHGTSEIYRYNDSMIQLSDL